MSEQRRVAVIGVGNIGGAIARNLLADGHLVWVLDSDAGRVAALVEAGARAARDAAEVAREADLTFLSLPTPAVMRVVADAWLEAAPPERVLIDLTTNSPDTVREVGCRLAGRGCHLLECPLTGGAPGAQMRMLTFLVGGDAAVYTRVKPLLDGLGRASFHLGPLGAGNVGKLINSLFAFTTTWISLEGLAVATRAGLDIRTLIEAVRAGGGGNLFIDRMVEGINERGRPSQFALELAAKDAGLLLDVARELGVPTPVAAEVAQGLVAAKAMGLGGRDFTDLVEVVERLAGVQIRIGPPLTAAKPA